MTPPPEWKYSRHTFFTLNANAPLRRLRRERSPFITHRCQLVVFGIGKIEASKNRIIQEHDLARRGIAA